MAPDKWKEIMKIGAAVGKPFIPGAAGSVLETVVKAIADEDDPQNVEGLKALAHRVDELEHAIVLIAKKLNEK